MGEVVPPIPPNAFDVQVAEINRVLAAKTVPGVVPPPPEPLDHEPDLPPLVVERAFRETLQPSEAQFFATQGYELWAEVQALRAEVLRLREALGESE